jgi:hypothetical protein
MQMSFVEYFKCVDGITDGFPLTNSQAEAFFPGKAPLINRQGALDPRWTKVVGCLVSGLDVGRLQMAAAALVNRHEALRTTFVLHERKPYQKSSPKLEAEHYFKIFEPVDTADQAIAISRDYVSIIPVDGATPLRIAVLPIRERHCIILGVNHFFVDKNGLRTASRDLWQAYDGIRLETTSSTLYEDGCRAYAKLFLDKLLLSRCLSHWSCEDRPLSIPHFEPMDDGTAVLQRVIRSVELRDNGEHLQRFSRSHRILPSVVIIAKIFDALQSCLDSDNDLTVLMTLGSSHLNRKLLGEIQNVTRHVPITFGRELFSIESLVGRCHLITRYLFEAIRHAVIPPVALPTGGSGQLGGLWLNVSAPFKPAKELPKHLLSFQPIRVDNGFRNGSDDLVQKENTTYINAALGEWSPITIIRRLRDPSAMDELIHRLQRGFSEFPG